MHAKNLWRMSSIALLCCCLGVAAWGQRPEAAAPKPAATPSAARVDFDRDIQPILTRRCIQCHGPSQASGGLRFTDRQTALKELKSGRRAIIPGKPGDGELLRRVTAEDLAERMPPKGEPLTAGQIELLRRWVTEGADWPAHWAYRPLRRPDVAKVSVAGFENWPLTPVDHFILAKLKERGMQPSPPADKRTWLRRVTFDLTGLPPTIEERDAFLADTSPAAYEKVVDRLLASPHYGERWARHWMDIVHYAETHGHDQDRPRPNAWPYRDYLIRSFNEDKPYTRFVQEQIAGDVLYPDDANAIIATGFLATGPWDESSLRDIRDDTLDRETGRYLDRDDMITTAISTFASTSVHCARCHDHKFDPIPQVEYYRLQAVFAAVDKADRPYDTDAKVRAARLALLAERNNVALLRQKQDTSILTASLQTELSAWEKTLAATELAWTTLDPVSFTSANGATLMKKADSVLSSGPRPDVDTYTIVANTNLKKITGVRLEVMTDDGLPMKGPGRQDNGNLHLNEFQVSFAPLNRDPPPPSRDPQGSAPAGKRATLKNPKADFNQEGWTIERAIDGNADSAWGIYPEVGKPHRATFEFAEPIELPDGVTLTFRLEQTHGRGHLIGRLRLAVTAAPAPLPTQADTLPKEIKDILAVPAEKRTDRQRIDLAAYYREQQLERQIAALPAPQLVYAASNQFKPDGSFKPAPVPRPIHLLERGEITKPGPVVPPGTISCVPGLETEFKLPSPEDEGARRVALARWLTEPQNVLTWRSIVNRVWHYHFGRGLASTPNDFGRMGIPPTHPELLDWLAVMLQENGGSLKKLHKLIVLSAVYRQSSQHDARFAELDSDNQYLWRMNRVRLDAESVRDAGLLVSGKLDRTMGGASVKQFIESPGVHVTPNVDYLNFDVDHPSNYRRSVYRFIFRTLPDPFMDVMDCPDSSQLTPARNVSVTPLQALAMLNNKFMIRQSEHLAVRVTKAAPDLPGQVKALYEIALGREPTPKESQALVEYAAKHGLANTCRVILNSNEFMFVN